MLLLLLLLLLSGVGDGKKQKDPKQKPVKRELGMTASRFLYFTAA